MGRPNRMLIWFLQLVGAQAVLAQIPDFPDARPPALGPLLATMKNQILQNGELIPIPDDIVAANPEATLAAVEPYLTDANPKVRRHAYGLCYRLALLRENDRALRRQVTRRLMTAFRDPEAMVWQWAARRLLEFFGRADFDDKTKETIRHVLKGDKEKRPSTVLIAGLADLQDQKRLLRSYLADVAAPQSRPGSGKTPDSRPSSDHTEPASRRALASGEWHIRLALARMGSKTDVMHCIELLESEADNEFRVTRMLHDLSYARHPEVIKVLARYLNSEARLEPVKPGAPGSLHAQYALWYLAESIEGLPLDNPNRLYNILNGPAYSQDEINRCRQWMSQEKNWLNRIRR